MKTDIQGEHLRTVKAETGAIKLQGSPRGFQPPREARKKQERIPPQVSGSWPANFFILDFQIPELLFF